MKKTSRTPYKLHAINSMDRDAFVSMFGSIFEASPWVAEEAWQSRPFGSEAHLVETLCETVRNAGRERQLVLLRAHPELGTRRPLAGYSAREQSNAGLKGGEDGQAELLAGLNRRYRDKFGFPFILAVKELEPDEIIMRFQERLENSLEDEFDECLQQVFRIARYRLEGLLGIPGGVQVTLSLRHSD